MSPVQLWAVGRHRRPTASRFPYLAVTAAMSGTLVMTGATTATADNVVGHHAATSRPTLQYTSSGDAVRSLQKRLGVHPTSGWFGPLTRAAVTKFQRAHGLPGTGLVGDRTWAALDGAGRPAAPAVPARPAAPRAASTTTSEASSAASAKRSQPVRATSTTSCPASAPRMHGPAT